MKFTLEFCTPPSRQTLEIGYISEFYTGVLYTANGPDTGDWLHQHGHLYTGDLYTGASYTGEPYTYLEICTLEMCTPELRTPENRTPTWKFVHRRFLHRRCVHPNQLGVHPAVHFSPNRLV